jgi:hypothetical protein
MKKYLFPALILVASCGRSPDETKKENAENALEVATEVSTSKPDTLCFLRTEGTKNQDTNAVRLIITNDAVVGKMMYLPNESDWRLGELAGKKDGNLINASWKYMQEGMLDTIQVSFKIDGDKLYQKQPSYDPKTGEEFLTDTAQYRLEYYRVDCAGFPQQDFDFGVNP